MIVRRLLRALRRRDDGVALPAVIGIGLVITLLVMTGAAVSTSGAYKSYADAQSLNAMQAAYAGIADYQSRITNDNGYWHYGTTTPFTTGSTFTGTNSNPAFGTTASGTWATVSGSNGTESYRYEVNNAAYASTGSVHVRVTGRAGGQTRSLVATVRGTGFIDYLYFTDFESSNPALTGETQAGNYRLPCLSVHMTDPAYSSMTACQPVQFAAGDVLGGPIRTNDEFTICGATFKQTVQSTAANNVYNKPSGCGNANFTLPKPQPAQVSSLDMPQTNTDMIQAARSDTNAAPGCVYTGPTSITFNADGSMNVISPWSKATQIYQKADGTFGGTMASACGSAADLRSATGAKVTLSANLVYVQNVPTDPSNPNYPTSQPTTPGSGAIVCSKTTTTSTWWGGTTSTTTYGNGLLSPLGDNYPGSSEYVGSVGNTSTASPYYCRNGDVFVSGTFHGALTIGAQSHVYVVGSIVYKDAVNDILGLVGQTSVAVWNPMACSGGCTLLRYGRGANVTIDAAIASNGGTFTVQNYAYGPQLGTLTVLGSIAQEWRGAVGTSGGTGFTKSYGYDTRLRNTAPPKFLQPVTTAFSVSQQVEVSAAYTATGAPTS
ncbi:hypothetical protein [Pseudolysinimonas sp.]|uniref:hypothetical protein n=1 Tax=Pseudolysinimonas sp. TaxID=2680009 RepID=UPI003F7FDE8C